MKAYLASTIRCIFALPLALYTSLLIADSSGTLSGKYITLAIQGDLRAAEELFEDAQLHTEADLELKQEFEERFLDQPGPGADLNRNKDLVDELAVAYRSYWRDGLLGKLNQSETEKQLSADLEQMQLAHTGASMAGVSEQNSFPGQALGEAGFYFLDTVTPPYRDLFIWREQSNKRYRVQLTDISITVSVNFMDDFVIQGWKEYASLGLATTTGWVENGELFCVAWAYDTAAEDFAVSYLKHEARHLVDLQKYPDMQPVELEYRAKLTELSYAHSSLQRILDDFRIKSADNPDSAHAMANWRVTRDLYRKLNGTGIPEDWGGWEYPDTGRVNRIARELLEENTRGNKK